VLEHIKESSEHLPSGYFAAVYLLRQACIVLDAAQLTPADAAAVMAARGKA